MHEIYKASYILDDHVFKTLVLNLNLEFELKSLACLLGSNYSGFDSDWITNCTQFSLTLFA